MKQTEFESIKNKFIDYVKTNYDLNNKKCAHKFNHTLKVVEVTKDICVGLQLNETDTFVALVIALLHDIGRFEQAKNNSSFREEVSKSDHATIGVKMLFDKQMIRDFIDDDKYDSYIKIAIDNHSRYKIEDNLSEKELMFSKIIRDADKLDNFRNKVDESIYVMSDIDPKELENSQLSDAVFNTAMQEKPVLNTERITSLDVWVSYLALFFDLNYDISRKIVKDNNYVELLYSKYKISNKDSVEKLNMLKKVIINYFEKH